MVGRILETGADVAEGAAFLARTDPRLAAALEATGPLPLRRQPDGFAALMEDVHRFPLAALGSGTVARGGASG